MTTSDDFLAPFIDPNPENKPAVCPRCSSEVWLEDYKDEDYTVDDLDYLVACPLCNESYLQELYEKEGDKP